jgi:hypothetical protein
MIRYQTTQQELEDRIEAAVTGWCDRAQRLTDRCRDLRRYDRLKPIWGEIKHAYLWLQNNKCAFCERLLFGGPGYVEADIEHFRPKKLYPLLSYHVLNYAVTCRTCNAGKRGRFPVGSEVHALLEDPSHGKSEKPLLVYPIGSIDEDPERLIGFDGILAIPLARRGYGCARAQATIDIFGLNRESLLQGRTTQIARIWLVLRLMEDAADHAMLEDYQLLLDQLTSAKSPYTSCSRSFLRLYKENRSRAHDIARLARNYLDALGTLLETPITRLGRSLSVLLSKPSHFKPGDIAFLEDLSDRLLHTLRRAKRTSRGSSPAELVVDTQAQEQILIGRVFEVCGLAGQIFRPTSVW